MLDCATGLCCCLGGVGPHVFADVEFPGLLVRAGSPGFIEAPPTAGLSFRRQLCCGNQCQRFSEFVDILRAYILNYTKKTPTLA